MIKTYGYLFVVLGAFFEGETVVLAAGFAVYRGYLDIYWVIVAAFAGAVAGDQLYFHLGHWKGAGFLGKRTLWKERVGKVRRLLERYRLLVIVCFRFVYGVRTVTPFVIGSSGFDPRAFLALDGAAAAAWSCLIVWLGYAFGAAVQALFGDVEKYEGLILLLVLCAGATAWVLSTARKWRSGKKKA